MCYVGRATKIFFFVVAVLMVAGLVLGFGLIIRNESRGSCGGDRCREVLPQPTPAAAANKSAPPLRSPPNPGEATQAPVPA